MKFLFHHDDKREEQDLCKAFIAGALARGHEVEAVDNHVDRYPRRDVVHCIIGVKNAALVKDCQQHRMPFLYFDKGYNRKWPEWWRASIGAHNPTRYIMELDHPIDRAVAQRWHPRQPAPDRRRGSVVIIGSSEKYHRFHDLPHPTEYAADMVGCLRQSYDTTCKIVYRPKPSWKGAVDIPGTVRSNIRDIQSELKQARVAITHGSAGCLDAMLAGVPCIVLGDGVTAPVCDDWLYAVHDPRYPTIEEQQRLLANLAYCQWTLGEFRTGEAIETIANQIERTL